MNIHSILSGDAAWQDDALCAQTGIDDLVWFPTEGQDASHARAICRMCPVQAECLAYALPDPGLKGVWGGLSERQRQKLRTQQRKEIA